MSNCSGGQTEVVLRWSIVATLLSDVIKARLWILSECECLGCKLGPSVILEGYSLLGLYRHHQPV